MREEVQIDGKDEPCYLVSFSTASDKDREEGKPDPCRLMVEMPNYKTLQVVSRDRIKNFVVVDAFEVDGYDVKPIRVSIDSALNNYYGTEHNAQLAIKEKQANQPMEEILEEILQIDKFFGVEFKFVMSAQETGTILCWCWLCYKDGSNVINVSAQGATHKEALINTYNQCKST